MNTITVDRNTRHSGYDLNEVVIDKLEFCRWSNYHIDTVNKMVREKKIPTINGRIPASSAFSLLLSTYPDGQYRERVKAWKRWLESGESISDALYVETDYERDERIRVEFEASKSPATKLMERENELDRVVSCPFGSEA